MTDAIRVFVGAPPAGLDAESQMVLEHSMRSRSSMPVDLVWMTSDYEPWSKFDLTECATPFSPFRYSVPEMCGFKGRAIYLDCDVILLADIAELWQLELPADKGLAARGGWRFDVTLFDCERVKKYVRPMPELMKADAFAAQNRVFSTYHHHLVHAFGATWNCLDKEIDRPGLKIFHYSSLPTQPHRGLAIERLKSENRRHWWRGQTVAHPSSAVRKLWDREYRAALDAGYTARQYYGAV